MVSHGEVGVIDYGNEKLNQIFRDTWPNLGWAKRMTHNLPEKDDAPWLDTTYDGFMTHEEMLEEAARREKENKVLDIAKNIMEENKEAFQHLAAIERKEFAERDFEDLTREQKIQLALEEIDWIVIGGQDGEEFYGSIQFLRKVLRSLV